MRLTVIRDTRGDTFTLGKLYINNQYFCETLEDRDRELEKGGTKIKGQTCIPLGNYEVELSMSPRFKKVLPLIKDVPGFTGIRIHAGNTDADTEGCLLVGYVRGNGKILTSRKAVEDLINLMNKAVRNKESITLDYIRKY